MTEKLQLPNPAPKGTEHEKWKAMVDSVIEFIAASRTMLHVLNERIKDSERFKEEEKKRMEDEKTKFAFYNECLHVEIKQRTDTKSATTELLGERKALPHIKEDGDVRIEKTPARELVGSVKEKGDRICGPLTETKAESKVEEVSSVSKCLNTVQNVDKASSTTPVDHNQQTPRMCKHLLKIVQSEEKNVSEDVQARHCHSKCKSCHAKHIEALKVADTNKGESALLHEASVEIQSSVTEETAGQSSASKEKCLLQCESTLIKTHELSGDKNSNTLSSTTKTTESSTIDLDDVTSSPPVSKRMPSPQSGNTLIKYSKISKIPRTKSFADDKAKSTLIGQQTPNEGANFYGKRTNREPTYRNLYQRNKTVKGDGVKKQ